VPEKIPAVAASTRLLEELVSSAPEPLYVIGPAAEIVFINPAGLRLLGYEDRAELVGRDSHNTIHYLHPDGTRFDVADCPLVRQLASGKMVRVPRDCLVRKDGSLVPVAYTSAPLETDAGRGAAVSFRDLTEQLRAEERVLETARTEAMRASSARLLEAADSERRRVARDLHDGAQQRLVEAMIAMQLAHQSAHSDPAQTCRHIDEALTVTKAAISDLRELSQGIHPRVLLDRGLAAAISTLADRMPCPVELDITPERFARTLEATAYFVVAEALTNVAKHAHATHAQVTIAVDQAILLLTVSDNGLDGAHAQPSGGLQGMIDRVMTAGGEFLLESTPGAGTTIQARLPITDAGTSERPVPADAR
jgi:PAS domain S-box-containing protein